MEWKNDVHKYLREMNKLWILVNNDVSISVLLYKNISC